MNIMTKSDYQFSEEFKEKSIYRRIMEDWSKDDGLLTKTYVDRSEKYRAPDSLVGLWKEMIVGYQNELINEKVSKRVRDISRIDINVDHFQNDFINTNIDYNLIDCTPVPQWKKDSWEEKNKKNGKKNFKKKVLEPVGHNKFLPNGVAIALINEFRVMPGEEVLGVQRGLATLLARGKIVSTISVSELVQYVRDNGGFSEFLKNSEKHPMIE